MAALFASHPPTRQRLDNVTRLIQSLPRRAAYAPAPFTELRKTQAALKRQGLAPKAAGK